jgi:hypothetical protein
MAMTGTWGAVRCAVAFRGQGHPSLAQPLFPIGVATVPTAGGTTGGSHRPGPSTGYRNLAENRGGGVTGTGIGSSETLPGGSYPTSDWRAVSWRLAQQGRSVQ